MNAKQSPDFESVITTYWKAVEAGQAPLPQEWIARYPHLAADLEAFFAGQQHLDRLAAPLREGIVPAAAKGFRIRPAPGNETSEEAAGGAADSPEHQGRNFGDYELLEEIGRGGMGVVYKARQVSLNRVVALKMILAGELATSQEVQRFRSEARAAANLDHPGIVPIYAVGVREGHHYFTMKLIAGPNLAQLLPDFSQKHREAARLLAQVARAVHHANERGVLHRDLKPANILIDARKQAHVTDFGLAKLLGANSSLSPTGQVVGTANYMAPEQAAARQLSRTADVYSLGAILYEMFTGRPPFQAPTILQTLRQVIEKEPKRPRLLNPRIDRNLETICLTCLDKRPHRRYASAADLANDLEAWDRGMPIKARRVRRPERAWLWCRRNPLLAALTAVAFTLAVVAAGLGVSHYLNLAAEERAQEGRNLVALQQQQERDRLKRVAGEAVEEQERQKKEQERQAKLTREAEIDAQRKEALILAAQEARQKEQRDREDADREATRLRKERLDAERKALASVPTTPPKAQEVTAYLTGMRRAVLLAEREQTDELRRALDPFRAKPGQPELRSWEWYFLHALQLGQESSPVRFRFRRRIHDVPPGQGDPPHLAWGKDGRRLAVLDRHGDVQILDITTGSLGRTLANKVSGEGDAMLYRNHALMVSPDGHWLVQAFTARSDGAKGRFSPRRYSLNGKLWDLSKGTVAREFIDVSEEVSWAPDRRHLYVGGDRIWDLARSAEQKLEGHQEAVRCISWNPDGSRLATGTEHGIRFWDPATGREVDKPLSVERAVEAVAWSPAGTWMAIAASDTLSVWDTHTRKELWSLGGASMKSRLTRLTWTLDGKRLIIAGWGGGTPYKLIEGSTGREISTPFGFNNSIAYCPDGKRLAVLTLPSFPNPRQPTPTVLILDIDSGQELLRLDGLERGDLSWSPDGKSLGLAGYTGMVHVWSIAPFGDSNPSMIVQADGELAWSPDGSRCAFPLKEKRWGHVRIQSMSNSDVGVEIVPSDVANATPTFTVTQIYKLTCSPDGRYLGTVHIGGDMYLWQVASGKRLWRLAGHSNATGAFITDGDNGIHDISWAPGSRWLASAAVNGVVKVWDTVTGKVACSFDLGASMGNRPELSWSGDGKYLMASAFGVTREWEIPAGRVVHSLKLGKAVMSPDGKLAALAVAGAVRLWETATGHELQPLESGERSVQGSLLSWSPDSRYLVYPLASTHIWDVQARSCKDAPGTAQIATWDPEGKKVLLGFRSKNSAGYWELQAFDAQSGEQVRDFGKVRGGASGAQPQLHWMPSGPRLAVAHELRFSAQGPRLSVLMRPHAYEEVSAEQGVVEITDLRSGQSRFTARVLEADPTTLMNVHLLALAWKPDGTALATVHQDAALRLWDPVSGQALRRLSADQNASRFLTSAPYPSIDSLAWAPDGERVAYARNAVIQVWNVLDEKKSQAVRAASLRGGSAIYQSIAWSPDNRRLATLVRRANDAIVIVWDTASWREIRSFSLEGKVSPKAGQLVCWSPDSKRLAAGVQSIHVWDAETGTDAFELSAHTVPLESLEWSDDGHRLVSRAATSRETRAPALQQQGPMVQELIVWDAQASEQILKVNGKAVSFQISRDWSWLAVPSADNGVIRLQHLPEGKR
jgi:WD40 repeat protein